MTLLRLIQEFCRRTGQPVPSVIASSTDPTVVQYLGLANAVCEDLVLRPQWQALTLEATFTSVAAEAQGVLTTLAPKPYLNIVQDTLWDRTANQKYFGPLTPQERQERAGRNVSTPQYQFYVRTGILYLTPAPAAGHTMAFEYTSNGIVADATTPTTFKTVFEADGDDFRLPENIMYAGLQYMWRLDKGLPFEMHLTTYLQRLAQAAAQDRPQKTLSMDTCIGDAGPRIVVPAGSWDL